MQLITSTNSVPKPNMVTVESVGPCRIQKKYKFCDFIFSPTPFWWKMS